MEYIFNTYKCMDFIYDCQSIISKIYVRDRKDT